MNHARLTAYIEMLNQLNASNTAMLGSYYHEDIEFVDPFHHIKSLPKLDGYFQEMYQHVISCHFSVQRILLELDNAVLIWKMTLSHRKINGSRPYTVDGASYLAFREDKIYIHRDFFDAGALIYEQLPLLGRVVKWIKAKI